MICCKYFKIMTMKAKIRKVQAIVQALAVQ